MPLLHPARPTGTVVIADRTAAALPSTYPEGDSIFSTAQTDWPAGSNGQTVRTTMLGTSRGIQEVVAQFSNLSLRGRWWRYRFNDSWGPFQQISAQQTAVAFIATSEATTSTSFVDLATPGPEVSIVVGPSGIVVIDYHASAFNQASGAFMCLAVNGTNDTSNRATSFNPYGNNNIQQITGRTVVYTGLTPGATMTYRVRYSANGTTGPSYQGRTIVATTY